jgi:hypothetical protein
MALPKKQTPVATVQTAPEPVKTDPARQRVLIGYHVVDGFGAIQKTGSIQIYTSALDATEPRLLWEVMRATGFEKDPDFVAAPKKTRLDIIAISPIKVDVVTSTADPRYLDWVKKPI